MDSELLLALFFLWSATTSALFIFLTLWFGNDKEAFHPHSVDVDSRHYQFLVVKSETLCKEEFAVKSISAFVAPRGSSSSKYFTTLLIMISMAGMFGTFRWHRIGDGKFHETIAAMIGFCALFLPATFESDSSSDRFLEDKLLVTAWLMEKIGAKRVLNFSFNLESLEFRQFLRQSKLYHLYEEDFIYVQSNKTSLLPTWPYMTWWSVLHLVGAVSYISLVTYAIVYNDSSERGVAWITGLSFYLFCFMGYLTGAYLPVISPLKCIILVWNPFLRDADYLLHLKEAIIDYHFYMRGKKEDLITEHYPSQIDSVADDSNISSDSCSTSVLPTSAGGFNANTSFELNSLEVDSLKKKQIFEMQSEFQSPTLQSPSNGTSRYNLRKRNASPYLNRTISHNPGRNNPNITPAVSSMHAKQKRKSIEKNDSIRSSTSEDICLSSEIDDASNMVTKSSEHRLVPTVKERHELDMFFDENIKILFESNIFMYYAHKTPQQYLHVIGHVLVMSELIAVLTPAVAMGIQWVTALCHGSAVFAFIELISITFKCVWYGQCDFEKHCIVMVE